MPLPQSPFRKPQAMGASGAASQSSSPDVMTALEEQVDCYRRLAKLAAIQHQHIQQEQTEALLDVLRSRQEVLDKIGQLEAIVGAAKKSWSTFVVDLAADRRAKAEALFAETRKLLEEIMTSDRNDVLVLQQRKLNIGKQIGQAAQQRAVGRTYNAIGQTNGRMDLQQ